jgi:GcrA cell cycle regulator
LEKTVWTPEIDARLRELHSQALVFRQIAAILNADFGLSLTRNACIGRGRRIGLGVRTVSPPRQRPRKPRAQKPKKVTVQTRAISPRLHRAPPIVPGALTMLQLNNTTCHWPSGTSAPYTYCGKPVHGGKPFCLEHCKMGYQKPEKTWT